MKRQRCWLIPVIKFAHLCIQLQVKKHFAEDFIEEEKISEYAVWIKQFCGRFGKVRNERERDRERERERQRERERERYVKLYGQKGSNFWLYKLDLFVDRFYCSTF